MTTRFSSIDDLLKEKPVTPLQEATMELLAKADYRPEPIDTPFIPGVNTRELVVAPQRVLEVLQILAAYDMPATRVYALKRGLVSPLTREEDGEIVPDDNFKMNIIHAFFLVFFPFGFYYMIGRWMFYNDTIVVEIADGSYLRVLKWHERISFFRFFNVLWWLSWFVS